MKKIHYSKIIGITGNIGAGKTVLAKILQSHIESDLISSGNFIRKQASNLKINEDRENLQNLGIKLINEYGYEKFLDEFIKSELINLNNILIVEGIRHFRIWELLQKYSDKNFLIFSDIDKKLTIPNIEKRDKINKKSINISFKHSVEYENRYLKKHANLILNHYINEKDLINIIDLINKL